MRTFGLTLAALVLAGPIAVAQSPGVPAKPPAGAEPVLPAAPVLTPRNQQVLDHYLKAWEKRMTAITTLEAKCVLTEIGVAEGEKEERRVSTGEAQLMKPNFAKLLLKDPQDPGNAKRIKHIVADGQHMWDYNYAKKIAGVQQLPKEGIGNNTLMSFLFGMTADQLKARYHLSVDEADPKKYTKHYLHITILPKTKQDLAEFKKAELVLWKPEDPKEADLWMLPARLWFQQTNKDQIVWQFENMTTKKNLTAKTFEAPGFPDKSWKPEWIKPPTPEVVRPVSGTGPPKK